MMATVFRTTREWFLVAICLMVILTQVVPQTVEWLYPILDFKGGKQHNMEVDKPEYKPGDTVDSRFYFQKQRDAIGSIKWQLVRNCPEPKVVWLYPPREVASPVMIIDHWAPVEKLPQVDDKDLLTGRYQFQGTISYPMWLGKVSYGLDTRDFKVVNGGEKK